MKKQGAFWEQIALQHLSTAGCQLVAKNYHCREGEIDLVMLAPPHLLFVEVRKRKRSRFTSAAASVSQSKQTRISLAARSFLHQHPQYQHLPCRFDVVTITEESDQSTQLAWIKNAFYADT